MKRFAAAALVLLATVFVQGAERDLRTRPAEETHLGGDAVATAPGAPVDTGDLDGDGRPELLAGYLWEARGMDPGGRDVRLGTPSIALRPGVELKLMADLDGDTLDDAVVAEPNEGTFGVDRGRVHVLFGPVSLPVFLETDPAGAEAWTLSGDGEFTLLGAFTVLAADFNGDGFRDLLVEADCCEESVLNQTRLYGIAGPFSRGGSLPLAQENPMFQLDPGRFVGWQVATGDLDGDGRDDLAVVRSGGGSDGKIYFGRNLSGAVSTPDQRIERPLGRSLESLAVGDVNGDALADVAVGLPDGAGEVHVVFGRPVPAPRVDLESGEADLVIRGAAPGDALGASLAIGDWTGDGLADLVIGAPGSDGPGGARTDAGAVFVVAGDPSIGGEIDLGAQPPVLTLHGADAGDRLGGDESGIGKRPILLGDTDGDGADDLVLTSRGRGVGNAASSPLTEIHVLRGEPGGPFDFLHSIGDPTSLVQEDVGIASPFDGMPGWVGDGLLHFFRIEEPADTRATLAVTRQTADATVRLSWDDGPGTAVAPDPGSTEVSVGPACVRPDGLSAATLRVTPRDAAGDLLGAGVRVLPLDPDLWGGGVPSGGFRDLGNGVYTIEIAAAAEGATAPRVEVEGVAFGPVGPVTFEAAAPTVTIEADPAEPTVGTRVSFTATPSGGTPPYTHSWAIDQAGPVQATGAEASHTFRRAGEFAVVVEVRDAAGCLTRAARRVRVLP